MIKNSIEFVPKLLPLEIELESNTTVRTQNSWEEWVLYILESIKQTALESIEKIKAIRGLIHETKVEFRERLPKLYSKDLLEILFKHPYTKIGFLVDELGVTRKTASLHLKAIEEVGILESIKMGRDVYFVNKRLFAILKVNRLGDVL